LDYGRGISLQPAGRIVVTGFASNGSNNDLIVVRFMP
jgi:hypothetical protein